MNNSSSNSLLLVLAVGKIQWQGVFAGNCYSSLFGDWQLSAQNKLAFESNKREKLLTAYCCFCLGDRSLGFQLQEFAVTPVLFPETKRKVSARLESCCGRVDEVLNVSILRRKATIT